MKMTSAYANKLLKQLSDEKSYWVNKETSSSVYTVAVGETPVVPDYDYNEVSAKIDEIDRKVATIKHAINLANVTSMIKVGEEEYSIDTILIRMAQLNKRKAFLDVLRNNQEKSRKEADYFRGRPANPEYQYINYDLAVVKQDFDKVSQEIMAMQMALDKYNQTHEFEVEI